ncbi:aminotransferase class V-fold PLP-dependent enzyme [Pseudonocardia spinosispora]|uniref:aminotransferase class V-fold PLP-dependent enzyme n=1 Tax=Pseudonocardia spinosispora TaxID=103441 RepID=UPI0003F6FB92|nr:aminotransferase class V-fold PLP-dependent enzyme [Pseudonocardia spinosispora]
MTDLFLLDPDLTHLNHGAFGACPRPVFDVYQRWQRELERSPSGMFDRLDDELAVVRRALAAYLGAQPEGIALVLNATVALNTVLRSLRIGPGDELLTTEHEYGAIRNALSFVAGRTGARVVVARGTTAEEIWAGATARTRALVVSHISSPTALLLPVERLCALARDAGVLSVVDGAHGPGQLDLDLDALGADVYVGNCHKWLCAPKAAAFLHTRREVRPLLDPLAAGWGWGETAYEPSQDWRSARDPSAYLSVPAAIDFVTAHGRQAECRDLLRGARTLMADAGFAPFADEQPIQMAYFLLPACDPAAVTRLLRSEFAIDAPVRAWNTQPMVRISIAPYVRLDDIQRLAEALTTIFSTVRASR